MSLFTLVLITGTAAFAGLVLGYFLRWLITLGQKGSMELTIKQMMFEAKDQAQKIIDNAEEEVAEKLKEIKEVEKQKEIELKTREERLLKKDDLLDKRQTDLEQEKENLKTRAEEMERVRERISALEEEREQKLRHVAQLSPEEAREEIIRLVEKKAEEDLLARMRKLTIEHNDKLETKGREILTTIIQRLANSSIPEVLATTVEIPSDDIKGKIIGKEGRNIRAFEKATGVEVIIDDTPGTVTLSSFDPVRRQVAKTALIDLIADGRIQPAKIEEMVEKARETIAQTIKQKGEAAAYEAGVFNLDPRITLILGRLHFRSSYGQNVLQHSVEMAHLAGMLAEELGADPTVARAGALLHDIGKAVDHEVPGTHVEIGKRILEKFGASPEVVKAMQAHHEEYPYETLESRIVQAADAISGARPGARRDSIENYIKRLKELEDLANTFPGIERVYAIQAGREIRVFVKPQEIGDLEAQKLAREIALRVEQELKYPGEIKVTVIRESRVIEYAR
ncbi:ribonuclease Y [Candidatus Nomurabacteria bacterium]|nr:ribonuclease Y [Candidatus Nomurabacteria bacterium]